MKRAFVSLVNSYVGYCVASALRRHGYDVVGSVCIEETEDIKGLVSQTVDANDEAGTAQLALLSDVVVLCLIEDVRGADAIITAFRTSRNDVVGPSHLLVLSTTMTWANTKHVPAVATANEMASSRALSRPVSMAAMNRRSSPVGGALPRATSAMSCVSPSRNNSRSLGTGSSKSSGRASRGTACSPGVSRRRRPGANPEPCMTEGDYLLRQHSAGYLEHKRLEVAALSLRSTSLSICIVGAGVPYGLGEGPLLRIFREVWRASDGPVVLPTCTSGDNHLALIHVADLSIAVGNLLSPVKYGASPAPFPKPYILAVEGDGAQCTAKEFAAAIARGFGRDGKTQPMGEAELEGILVEDPAELSLLIDVRFSNNGGVLSEMVAEGTLEPIAWSKGFVASATLLAQEFIASRSLSPIKSVILGPPGGSRELICKQIARRYGSMYVDAKVAVDGVFAALGKPLPEPAPAEDKTPPQGKGKKGKDTKKGAGKGELSQETQAILAALSPPERILHDVHAVFEAADVPMSEYTSLDAGRLTRLLPPPLVARAARFIMEETREQWARRDAASKIFADRSPSRSSPGINSGAAASSRSRGEGSGGNASSTSNSGRVEVGEFRPTHVVYLDATTDFIVAQRGEESSGVGKYTEASIRAELERYFAQEQKEPETDAAASAENAPQQGRKGVSSDGIDRSGHDRNDDRDGWIPATATALRDGFMAKTKAINAEAGLSEVVDAVALHLSGGQVPAFVRMHRGPDGEEESCDGKTDLEGATVRKGGKIAAPAGEGRTAQTKIVKDKSAISRLSAERTGPKDSLDLVRVLAKMTSRDAKEVELRTRRHRSFLTNGVVPQVAAGLVAAAEVQPEDPFEFLADYLIRAGRALQSKAEAEASLKYHAGLALLKELEAQDNKRAAVEICERAERERPPFELQ